MRTLRAQLPNGKLVTLQSSGDHPINPGGLVFDALGTPEESRGSAAALVRDLFPGAFPDLVDCGYPPVLDPSIHFGPCSGPQSSKQFEGWAFWCFDPRGDSTFLNLVSHEVPSRHRTTEDSIQSWESNKSAHSLSTQDHFGYIEREFHIVGRRGEHEWLDSTTNPTFISWDNLIERCTPSLRERSEATPSIILIDELISSTRRILAMLARDRSMLAALDSRRFEECVAVLLSDLGFDVVELTRPGKDAGRDLVIQNRDSETGVTQTILVECKHWTSRKYVGIDIALQLLDVIRREDADGGILIATGGFAPTLVELHAQFKEQHLQFRDSTALFHWLEIWERTFASPLLTPVSPMELIGLR